MSLQPWEKQVYGEGINSYEELSKDPTAEITFGPELPPGYLGGEELDENGFPTREATEAKLYGGNLNYAYDEDPEDTFFGQVVPFINTSGSNPCGDAGPFHMKNPSLRNTPSKIGSDMVAPGDRELLGVPVDTGRKLPLQTDPRAITMLDKILSFAYWEDGFNALPFVKVTTKRVFLPVLKNKKSVGTRQQQKEAVAGLRTVLGGPMTASVTTHVNEASKEAVLKPFPICVCPEKIAIPQRSTRYVYGPWMTNTETLIFRGKVEYEQDENLLPENFLIPINLGSAQDFKLKQISGLAGLNMAAQGRANAIDDFALFAQEQGSISIQGPPAVKRIGDALYGIRNVTDIKVNVSNGSLKTSYSFKTISPKFGKNNKDVEKKLTKISNKLKKIKLV
jgi:hypothetical protein